MPDMSGLALLDVRTRATWHAWLERHHTSSRGVWLVFHKARTGLKSLPYEDFVGEALRVGWIDELLSTAPRTERRNFVVWIYIAKRPETRARRIGESIALRRARSSV